MLNSSLVRSFSLDCELPVAVLLGDAVAAKLKESPKREDVESSSPKRESRALLEGVEGVLPATPLAEPAVKGLLAPAG